MHNELIAKFVLSYCIGSLPFSVFLSKLLLNQDIRTIGSGNIGTSNAYRAGGFTFSLLVAFFDVSKSIFVIKYILPGNIGLLAVCLGQMYPLFLKFKGGKGMGCYLGGIFAINSWLGLLFISIWLALVKISKSPFISSMVIILASVLLMKLDFPLLIIWALIVLRHKSNMQDLLNNNRE